MVKVYQVHYVSRTGGHRGFTTFATLAEAKAHATALRRRMARVWIGTEER